jgi:hypothetical protein
MSVGLKTGAASVSGLGLQVAVSHPLRQGYSYGLAVDHLEDGLQFEPSRRAEYNTTSLSALLGWRVSGRQVGGYIRSGLGLAYVHEKVRATYPRASWVLEEGSDYGPAGQFGGGVEFSLDEKARGYIDLGVSQVWGGRPHTSGSLLFGVATRW